MRTRPPLMNVEAVIPLGDEAWESIGLRRSETAPEFALFRLFEEMVPLSRTQLLHLRNAINGLLGD